MGSFEIREDHGWTELPRSDSEFLSKKSVILSINSIIKTYTFLLHSVPWALKMTKLPKKPKTTWQAEVWAIFDFSAIFGHFRISLLRKIFLYKLRKQNGCFSFLIKKRVPSDHFMFCLLDRMGRPFWTNIHQHHQLVHVFVWNQVYLKCKT